MGHSVLRGLLAAVTTAVAIAAALPVLRRLHMVDVPTDRSSHARPTLRGGGVAIVVGSLVAFTTSPVIGQGRSISLVMFATACGVVGLVDDIGDLAILPRLVLQLLFAAVAVTWLLPGSTASAPWRIFVGVAVVVWLVGYVNAYNFFDGINGIAVAQAVTAGATWYAMGRLEEAPTAFVLAAIVITASCAAFAPFNFPGAVVFLGDVGSYFIGGWLAVVAVIGMRAGIHPEAILAPLTISLADTVVTRIRRLLQGGSWYLPIRSHAYQRLTQFGWSHTRTTLVAFGAMSVCGALGVAGLSDSLAVRAVVMVGLVFVAGCYLSLPAWVGRTRLASER